MEIACADSLKLYVALFLLRGDVLRGRLGDGLNERQECGRFSFLFPDGRQIQGQSRTAEFDKNHVLVWKMLAVPRRESDPAACGDLSQQFRQPSRFRYDVRRNGCTTENTRQQFRATRELIFV